MIRFGVVLSVVLIAIGLLVTGVVAGSLLLVVISIGMALLAFLLLIGVVISFRHEIFGRATLDAEGSQTSPQAPAVQGAVAGRRAQDRPVMAASRPNAERGGRPVRVSESEPAGRQASDLRGRPPADVGDRARRKQPPAQPAASAEAPDGTQKAAAAGTKAQPGPPARAQRDAEPARRAAPRAPVSQGEPGERESRTRSRARPEPATSGAAGGRVRGAGDPESPDRDRLATQHGAGRLDRPSAAQPGDRGDAERHRASRLERESARAAGSRPGAPEVPAPASAQAVAPGKPGPSKPATPQGPAAASPVKAAASAAAGAEREPAPVSAESATKSAEPAADAAVSDGDSVKRAKAGPAPGGPAGPDRTGKQGDQESAAAELKPKPRDELDEASGSPPDVPAQPARDGTGNGTAQGESSARDDDMQVSVVPGITRYHRADCQLIRFLTADDLELMTKKAATEGGCVPCKACKPDQVAPDAATG